ncbi:MAG: ABC transporter permease [Candidatus Kerfeldbacteria bacterium]|nr:ABC transporter permease [Candidatus Kerfeldbacteria bacterium]
MISLERIKALVQQEWYISKRSLEVIMDLPFFAVIDVMLFGYVAQYLVGSAETEAAYYLLLGAVFWESIRITQYSMTVSSLWNVWSRNLSNMFITPLSLTEYISAHMISGVLKSTVITSGLIVLTAVVFDFNVLVIGWWNVLFCFINLVMFSWSVGLVLLGLIFRYGVRVQALGWAVIFIFQPLSAAFFPVAVLPPVLQTFAKLLPPTYVFEAARGNLLDPSINWSLMLTAVVINAVYLTAAVIIFKRLFVASTDTGQFARNES